MFPPHDVMAWLTVFCCALFVDTEKGPNADNMPKDVGPTVGVKVGRLEEVGTGVAGSDVGL